MGKLIFIGLGLYDSKDISIKGLETLKDVDNIFAEFYTAKMAKGTIKDIEAMSGNEVTILTREEVEDCEKLLSAAETQKVAFLCQGDPLTATTHIELLLMATKRRIATQVIHSSSVATSVPGLLGLQFYKFGRTTTLAFPEGGYFPESPYDVISENLSRGLHTLVLLDIDAETKRYMTANEGIDILLKINSKRGDNIFTKRTLTCVVARAGSKKSLVVANSAGKLLNADFGAPLHTIVIPGKLHFKEGEALVILAKAPHKLIKS